MEENKLIVTLIRRRRRNYLNAVERERFLDAARSVSRLDIQTFALTLFYTGCRVSEALALRACDVDLDQALLYVFTVRRNEEFWREIPVPSNYMQEIDRVHRLREIQSESRTLGRPLWKFSRTTAFRYIDRLMKVAKIEGPQACSNGIRHGFGIAAVEAGVPLPTIAAVLGHSSLHTTAKYTTAIRFDDRALLKRAWRDAEA